MTSNPKILKQQEKRRQWVNGLLIKAQNDDWFGNITVEIKKGRIDLVRHEETMKPPKEEPN